MSVRAAGLAALVFLLAGAGASGLWRGGEAGPSDAAAAELPAAPFASLAGDRVNGRRGPGLEHRIDWVYQRRGLPLEIVGRSGAWTRVRDPDGAETWIASDYLSPTRTVLVAGDALGTTALKRAQDGGARTVAHVERGVVATLKGCRGDWRRVEVEGLDGWVRAGDVWAAGACADNPESL